MLCRLKLAVACRGVIAKDCAQFVTVEQTCAPLSALITCTCILKEYVENKSTRKTAYCEKPLMALDKGGALGAKAETAIPLSIGDKPTVRIEFNWPLQA